MSRFRVTNLHLFLELSAQPPSQGLPGNEVVLCRICLQNTAVVILPISVSGLKGPSGLIGVVNIWVEADTRRGLLIP